MDNTNDAFNSLGLEGITLQDTTTTSSPTEPTTQISETDIATPTSDLESVTIETSATPSTVQSNTDEGDAILNDLSDDETIDLFIEGIMEEKGINAPTEEIRQSIKNNLKNQLLTQIDRSLIAELPDDKLEELNRIAAANGQIDPNLIAQMIEESNLDVTDIVGTTMVRFRELYLGDKLSEADGNTEA